MTGFYHTILKFPELGPDIYLTEQANDGIENGEGVTAEITISNTAPVFTGLSFDPTDVYTDTLVTCLPSGWYDADEDTEGYTYEWTVDGNVVGS